MAKGIEQCIMTIYQNLGTLDIGLGLCLAFGAYLDREI